MTGTRLEDLSPAGFLDEHRAIQAAVQALQAHVLLPAPFPRPDWLRRLAEDLDALAGLLRPHFAREVADGMFDAIVEAEPGSAAECARLRGQHDALLDRLAALEQRLPAPRPDAKSVEEMRHEVGAMLADLARHEAAENALLVHAMEGQEVGAVD
jgi:hypothetical protein